MQSVIREQPSTISDGDSGTAEKRGKGADSAYVTALKRFTSGKVNEAKALVQLMLARNPQDARALHLMGLILYELGDLESAVARFRESVAADPSALEAWSDLAAISRDLGQFDEALSASLTAISLDAKYYPAYANLGRIYKTLGRPEESAACYVQAVEVAPYHARGHCDLGLAYLALGKTDEAVEACRRASELAPDDTDIALALGESLARRGRLDEAIALYEKIDLRRSSQLPVLCALATAYAASGQIQKALATHRRSLELAPDDPEANIALGDTLRRTGRMAEALNCYQFAVSVASDHAAAIAREADALADLGQIEAAMEKSKNAIGINAALPAPYRTIARALAKLGKHAEAFAVQNCAVKLDGRDLEGLADWYRLARRICSWDNIGETAQSLLNVCRQKGVAVPPYALLDQDSSAEDILLSARSWAKRYACDNPLMTQGGKPRTHAGEPIHLAYLYGDGDDNGFTEFLRAVISGHDRSRFRVSGFYLGGAGAGKSHAELEGAFDARYSIDGLCFAEAAARIHETSVDVLVCADGYFSRTAPAILAHRPAPVQVSFPCYPATMGADFVDYIIGDPFTTALDQQPFFDEKIVQLPDCLLATFESGDRKTVPDRQSQGLPEKAIVFCCFNPARTISPDCFAVWMNILKNVPGSVLWLLDDNQAATGNLKRSAAALGVDPARLIFAPLPARPDHLARLPLADLYMDTMPSSSATAVAQALAAGVPVLTCAGETMVSRISGSLLKACGLNDMITYAHEHYDHVAQLLTCDPRSLKQLRGRLAENIKTARLFDISRYQSGLDAAFEHMVAIARNGEWPYAFAVALDQDDVQKRQAGNASLPADDEEPLLLAEADAL